MTTEILYCTHCDEWVKQLAAMDDDLTRGQILPNPAGCGHAILTGVEGAQQDYVTKQMPDEWEWREP